MTLTQYQKEVLLRAKDFILNEKEMSKQDIGFYMDDWIYGEKGEGFCKLNSPPPKDYSGETCGTTMCIGGTIEFLEKKRATEIFGWGKEYENYYIDCIDHLFHGHPRDNITPQEATNAIDSLIEDPDSFNWGNVLDYFLDE